MTELYNCSPLCGAIIPVRATEGSAGYDVFAYNDKLIPKHSAKKICVGTKLEIPSGIYAEFKTRSSYALKNLNVVGGVIDSDYRGLLYVCLRNDNDLDYLVKQNDKIAQLIFYKCIYPEFNVVKEEELNETVRGEDSFGSTGN